MYSRRKALILIISGFSVFLVDRVTKTWALSDVFSESAFVLGRFFQLHVVLNTRAFGLMPLNGFLAVMFTTLALLLFSLFIFRFFRSSSWFEVYVGSGLVFGGAISNLVDRVIYDGVIDWMSVAGITVINIADIGVGVGLLLLFINLFRK